jgi:hypothetical protein
LEIMNVICTSSQGMGNALVWWLSGAYKNLTPTNTRVNTIESEE